MTFSINDIISEIDQSGISKPAHFDMLISAPSILAADIGESLSTRIMATELPGRGVQTLDQRFWGPPRKIGYQSNYTEMNITVICSRDLREREFFNSWHDQMIGEHRVSSGALGRYTIGYYDDYAGSTSAEITQYDQEGNFVKKVTLVEVYPSLVSPLALGWEVDDFHRLPVSLTYRYFTENGNVTGLGTTNIGT